MIGVYCMSNYLQLKKFCEINLNDPFFDSLKADYTEFPKWFISKSDNFAYILEDSKGLLGFLYIKTEIGSITDMSPHLNVNKALKIGTFKIDPHQTRLGERFIKKSLDHAIIENVDACYVTVFSKHAALLNLFKKYGFKEYGSKTSLNGTEIVLVKFFNNFESNLLLDYPMISSINSKKYLLAIYPEYHSKMFPDSLLNNETYDILEDVSFTNSIHKIYVCGMPVGKLNRGDIVIIYRTGDKVSPAEYRAVATSICVIEEVKDKNDFNNFEEFFTYSNAYSIFDRQKLEQRYNRKRCYAIKMTYNAALRKRLTRHILADEIGISRAPRWSFLSLNDLQFERILEKGDVNEGIIID